MLSTTDFERHQAACQAVIDAQEREKYFDRLARGGDTWAAARLPDATAEAVEAEAKLARIRKEVYGA